MKTTLSFRAISLCFLLMPGAAATAAVAPRSPEELEREATLIVTGTVVEVTSKTGKSEIERAPGLHRDRVFLVRVKVISVAKGSGVKTGDEIIISAWQPVCRIPALPGPQGYGFIPEPGGRIKAYLKPKGEGMFQPILPNGWETAEE
jgi:hypothetical protein